MEDSTKRRRVAAAPPPLSPARSILPADSPHDIQGDSQALREILNAINGMKQDMRVMKDHFNERFDEVNERFDEVDERFDEVDERFDVVDERLDALERHPREEVPKQAYRQFFERARSTPVPVYSATGTTAHTVNRIFKKCSDGDKLHLQDLHFLLQLKPRWVPLQEGSQPLSLMHAESEADSQHLMIRAIYPCILEKLKQAFTDKSAPGVILTGSPGVGKSWLGNLVVWQFIRLAAEPQAPLFHGTCADGSPKDRAVIYPLWLPGQNGGVPLQRQD